MKFSFAHRKQNQEQAREGFHSNKLETTSGEIESGQSLVEFALVVGLIIIVMLGSFEIFNLLQQKADLDRMILQVARQAGEFGGVSDTGEGQAELEAFITYQLNELNYNSTFISEAIGTLDISVTQLDTADGSFDDVTGTACQYGQFITVNMVVDWDISLPLVLFFEGFSVEQDDTTKFNLTSTARCWRAL